MANQEFPSLNDVAPSWADVHFAFSVHAGKLIDTSDVAALSWGRTVTVGKRKGAGGRARRRTRGSIEYEASATFYMAGLRQLVRALKEKAPVIDGIARISLVEFDVHVQHTPPGETDIYEVKIKQCRLLTDSQSLSEGDDEDQIEVGLDPMGIVNIVDGQEVDLL